MKTPNPKIGRPLSGATPRVRIFAHVAEATETQIRNWKIEADEPACKTGQVIDRLVAHGLATAWSPRKPEGTNT